VKRRDFITLLGGAAAVWPLAAHAQEPERMRRIGVLMNTTADTDQKASVATFLQMLQKLGWTEGRNLRVDIRWAGGDPARIRRNAEDLVSLAPDVIVATGNAGMAPLMQATRTVPITIDASVALRTWRGSRRRSSPFNSMRSKA
jgi:putative tryptophan/tyrosine transport system substrate-binding protein